MTENDFQTMLMLESRENLPGGIKFLQVVGQETVIDLPISYEITQCDLKREKSIIDPEMMLRASKILAKQNINFSIRFQMDDLEAYWSQITDLQKFINRFFSINIVRKPKIKEKILMNFIFKKAHNGIDPEITCMGQKMKIPTKWSFTVDNGAFEIGPTLYGFFLVPHSTKQSIK
ncbi:MAG: hypothetical protein ACXADA_15975 [Candidatus Hodarchaeales archaeon]